jgi:secondary thiamine-phosphate synthase enzyme
MVRVETIRISHEPRIAFTNVTRDVQRVVDQSGVKNGMVTVQAGLCICSITHMEFEPGSQVDLKAWVDKFVPEDAHYEHEVYNHDDNGHSHLRGTMFGASETFVVRDGRVVLDTWQQIVHVSFNVGGSNKCPVHICVMGE